MGSFKRLRRVKHPHRGGVARRMTFAPGVGRILPWTRSGIPRSVLANGTTSISRSVTAQALHESEQLFHLLVHSVQDYAIFMLDPNGLVMSWNRGAERIKGYEAHEIMGKSFTRFYLPEDIAAGVPQRALATALREGHFEGEYWRLRKDGTRFWANIVITAVYDKPGHLVGFAKITRDATQRRMDELALQQAKQELEKRMLERAAAVKELEAFSYSVSHDLRAPLRHIHGLSRALLEDYGDKLDNEGREFLGLIQEAGQHMEELVDEMLKLSQLSTGRLDRQAVSLNAVAASIVAELRDANTDRNLNVIIEPMAPVIGDPTLLRAVLYNLIENSVKFTGQRARADIHFGTLNREGQLVYFVRDNGAGFDMRYAERLFAPFQRLHTQTEFGGTGVGLATVQRILRRHGGAIWVEATVGEGATFYFTIGDIVDDATHDPAH